MVYSACSIDPCENEAVVAQLLRDLPFLELIEINQDDFSGLEMRPGLADWDVLDQMAKPMERGEEIPNALSSIHLILVRQLEVIGQVNSMNT